MNKLKTAWSAPLMAAALTLSFFTTNVYSQEQEREQARERIYGSQLMTQQERIEHRERMRTMQTNEQREAYRLEHHRKMQERARERGVSLPEDPPARGGMGPGGAGWGATGGNTGAGGGGGGRGR